MRILALTRYGPQGASSRVRFYQYFPYLESRGIQIAVSALLSDTYVNRLYQGKDPAPVQVMVAYARRLISLFHSRSFDLIWIEKELFPWLPPWAETLLYDLNIPYVVDYDDAIFHRYDLHPNPLVRRLLEHKVDGIMRRSSVTVAGNEYLAERARSSGARSIEILPSVVDLERYTLPPTDVHKELRVGWVGTPITAPYLDLIRPALVEVARKLPLRLILVGAHEASSLPEVPTEILPWSIAGEVGHIQSFDMGIMPLPDEPFERGKCGYKLIQYMSCGIPVVASPVGANAQIVEHGINGYLATTIQEWGISLLSLGIDREFRIRLGKAGRQKVEQEYSLQVTAPRIFDILQRAVSA